LLSAFPIRESEIEVWSVGAEVGQCSHEMGADIHVSIHTNPFREQDPQYSSIVIPLPNASADTRLLARAALFSLKKIYKPGYADKQAGVVLMGIGEAQVAQYC
jgi:hypothetical protein